MSAFSLNECVLSLKLFALMRADINFLAGIIKRGHPTAPYLFDAAGTSRASEGEKTMESFVDGICNLIGFHLVLGSMLGIYIAPLVVAVVRDHHRLPWIGLLNLAAGWTVAGWIAALVWSVTAIRQPAAIPQIGVTPLGAAQPAAT
jgi:hypothetical protein